MGDNPAMNFLFYSGAWPTNIGNSFIDYGSRYSIRTAFPKANLYFASELPRLFFKIHNKPLDNSVDMAELIDADVLFISGMVFCNAFIELEGPVLKRLSKRGVKIVLNGCGSAFYDTLEKNHFKKYLQDINVAGFISRDEYTFESFKDCFGKSYNRIDYDFFLSDAFKSAPFRINDYSVYTFDSIKEPQIENKRKIIRAHHSCSSFFSTPEENLFYINRHKRVARIAKRAGFLSLTERVELLTPNTLISDMPEDYLNLYANCYSVYSDRVHACVAALSFGKYARLYSTSPRGALFGRVGADKINQRLVKLDLERLDREKRLQLSFLSSILDER
jgi:hypothetical protein